MAQLACGCAFVPLLLLGHVVWQGAFAAAFADVLVHTATRYASIQGVPFGRDGSLHDPLVLIPVLNVLLLAAVCIQDWRGCLQNRVLRTAAASALAGFIAAYPRPDVGYLGYALPLTTCCIVKLARTASRSAVLACTACACVIAVSAARPLVAMQAAEPGAVQTGAARGAFAFREANAAAAVTRLAEEPGGERVFFYPYMPMSPYLAGRQQVSKYDVFLPFYTTDRQYGEACADTLRDASLVLVDWWHADMENLRAIFPAMPAGRTAAKDALEAVLRSRFTPVWRSGSFELLRRPPGGGETGSACPSGA